MSYSYNTRKKNIKNQRIYVDPATGQEKAAVGGKKSERDRKAFAKLRETLYGRGINE